MQAELLGAALASVDAPQVDGQMARDGYDGFLSGRSGGTGSFGQQMQPGWAFSKVELITEQEPRKKLIEKSYQEANR